MRDLSASLRDKLASGLTTFCHCWLLQRTDAVKLGFTDHDEDVTFDGVTYERLAGMTASAVTQSHDRSGRATVEANFLQGGQIIDWTSAP